MLATTAQVYRSVVFKIFSNYSVFTLSLIKTLIANVISYMCVQS